MDNELKQKRIAVLAASGFEEAAVTQSVKALEAAGAQVDLVAPQEKIRGWDDGHPGDEFTANVLLTGVNANRYDALLIPGGTGSREQLQKNTQAINFIRHFLQDGKPVAATGEGTFLLMETELLRGRKVAADPSLEGELKNAGGQVVAEATVVDRGLITSRTAGDVAAFTGLLIAEIRRGVNMDGRGIAAQHSLPGEGAEVPNLGHRFGRG